MSPVIFPVIHYADDNQAMRNAELAFEEGCRGVMLIEMRGRDSAPMWVAAVIKRRWPDRLVGLNFLNAHLVGEMPIGVCAAADMTWTDKQLTHSLGTLGSAHKAKELLVARPNHLFFCGVAFKYQFPEPNPGLAAVRAVNHGLIPTTSGPATGERTEIDKLVIMRERIGPDAPLAIASGVTPENARAYRPFVTHMLVATGISRTFHELDRFRLRALMDAVA